VRTLKAHAAISLVVTLAVSALGLADAASAETGEAVYRNNCALCHQTGAQGLAG